MDGVSPCPNCESRTLYRGPETSSGGGHAPNYLVGLGRFLRTARFTLVARGAYAGWKPAVRLAQYLLGLCVYAAARMRPPLGS